MSSSRLSQLIKHSRCLPIRLPQNSNLIIRTPSPTTSCAIGSSSESLSGSSSQLTSSGSSSSCLPIRLNVNIIPQWRDDGFITLEQVLPAPAFADNDLKEIDWKVQVTNHEESYKKELTNVDVLIDYIQQDEGSGQDEKTTTNASCDESPSITLNAKIPQKCNVSCFLHDGGNINVSSKLEGEDGFHFMTKDGMMTIDKLRGNNIDLICDHGGLIHVKKSCEAQDITVRIGGGDNTEKSDVCDKGISCADVDNDDSPSLKNSDMYTGWNRLRSKMFNVSNASIQVFENSNKNTLKPSSYFKKLDEDDGLALIDISSIYASQAGDGVHLETQKEQISSPSSLENNEEYPKKVRVKSNHGHVSVRTATSIFTSNNDSLPNSMSEEFGQRSALISLGGVNGSFDVSLESRTSTSTIESDASDTNINKSIKPMASSVHVDSLSPGQVSILTSDHGDVELTIDRKIESDIRLLSCPLINNLDPNILVEEDEDKLLASLVEHDGDIEDFHSISTVAVDSNTSSSTIIKDHSSDRDASTRILLETNAFSGHRASDFTYVEYVHGFVENKSNEPDSRFDVKTKGTKSPSIGKIDIHGAAGQALEGFSGGSSHEFERPLVAIGTDGVINLESLSWFGAISRRYGVKNDVSDLGRQAKAGGASIKTSEIKKQ